MCSRLLNLSVRHERYFSLIKYYVRILCIVKWILICVLMVGCGGLQRDLLYRPSFPALEDKQGQSSLARDKQWPLVMSEFELNVGEVVYSSKLIWVFGPFFALPTFWEEYVPRKGLLEISFYITAKSGINICFDLGDFTVILDDGRSLSPTAVARWGSSNFEPTGPVMLSGNENWKGCLQYALSLKEMRPFILQLGTLDVNGEPLRLPPIPFVHSKSYSGS